MAAFCASTSFVFSSPNTTSSSSSSSSSCFGSLGFLKKIRPSNRRIWISSSSFRALTEDNIAGGGGGSKGSGGGGGDNDDEEENKKKKMSMSQKLTLGYAALVGVGGVIGYVKSGSQKSLGAGGLSALLLYYVYTQLPVRPAFASSLGFGLSVALLVVMGSRFKRSGKVMPAGLVSLVSLVMTGGYLHGIMRGMHAA